MKKWFKNAKIRLATTITGGVSVFIGTGLIFDWRYALYVLGGEILLCAAYSLYQLHRKLKTNAPEQ